jgi:flagellin-like protein
MKGITPVIAIILLLLITVSMAGFAFVFLQRTLEETTSSTEQGLQNQLSQQGQKYAIDNTDDTNNYVYIRHIGTSTGDTSTVSVYINSALAACTWDVSGSWAPGTIKRCTAAFSCDSNTTIEASAPGGKDSVRC